MDAVKDNKETKKLEKKDLESVDRAAAGEKAKKYFNRELSWILFNRRVLDEAMDKSKPLLERVKFLSIFSNNLDEFFMIRVSGLCGQLEDGVIDLPPDGMTAAEQLAAIRRGITPDLKRQIECWYNDIVPELRKNGVEILSYKDLKDKQKKYLDTYFKDNIFPTLTPLAFDPGHPFPHISGLSLNFALVLRDEGKRELFARLKIPESFPRLLHLPTDTQDGEEEMLPLKTSTVDRFVWIEDLIRANISTLFPGMKIVDAALFRVTRDADIEIELDEAGDLLQSIREGVNRRRFGSVVRLEIEKDASKRVREILARNLELDLFQVYSLKNPIGMSSLMQLCKLDRPELKDPPFTPSVPPEFAHYDERKVFQAIAANDILLYHPYDSFKPVVDFIRLAASDPDVLAIKQTLYRTGTNSPIVEALKNACQKGKQVAALVELKARFDEENNIGWAKALESAGVHVVYGVGMLKTHAKLCLVVRREKNGIRRYVHMGTGNYNAVTAGIYTDFGLFTANPDIGADVSDLFNVLTGYSKQKEYRKLLVAPHTLRREIIARIDREIEHHKRSANGHIIIKLNALSDKESINALYRASQAGVKVELQIRGICCLRPQVPGMSDNITVTSIVGRFLEHTRAFYFHNDGNDELYLGSADLMMRNLDKRVETLFPIENEAIKQRILNVILPVHLRDDVQSNMLTSSGEYVRLSPPEGAVPINSQQWMIDNPIMVFLDD